MLIKKKNNQKRKKNQNKNQSKKYLKFNIATIDFKKQLQRNFPYVFVFWISNRLGEYFRLSYQTDIFLKIIDSLNGFASLGKEPFPSLYPFDILIGFCGAISIKGIVYFKGKNAKKYRKGVEYGSARWGTSEDIKPFIDPKFQNNILLTQTERIMMGRNKIPKYNINKNVLVIGGSGSGKTRYHVKPNLMQMNSSYIVTDPKGTVALECGKLLAENGYKIKILNTIDFKQSMKYNPFQYIRCENDILKLVNCIMENTKGEDTKGGEDFWQKAEALYYQALIAYIWYEALEHGGALPIHVTCLLDEFANQKIPNFQHLISVIRSREISAHIIVQTQSQLKAIYKDHAETIIGNCSCVLFLGGKERSTLKEISETLGKETIVRPLGCMP